MNAREKVVSVTTRGRYLVAGPEESGPAPLLVGFHGYGESADSQMDRLQTFAGSGRFLLVSIQGHNWFYDRTGRVVAGWMTSFAREEAISDNLAYVDSVLNQVRSEESTDGRIFWCGYSQGAAMAYRAAAFLEPSPSGVIVFGGDVPPDVAANGERAGARLTPMLLGRGAEDQVYPATQFDRDIATLEAIGAGVSVAVIPGGHEWSAMFSDRAGAFLADCLRSR